jgi:translation initiation factor 1 (eIF-1/SUI1)
VLLSCGVPIIASSDFPRVVWDNRKALPAKPYIVVSVRTTSIRDRTLTQTSQEWQGALSVTIVTGLDEFQTVGYTMASALADLFPAGSRIPLNPRENIMVAGHPAPKGNGYPDGGDWRLVMEIPLRTDG